MSAILPGFVAEGVKAVSYTHLDVYKRQPQVRKGAMVIVAQDTAKKFVQSLQSDEDLNLMQLQQSIISEAGDSGIFPNYTLDMFYDSLYEQRGAAVVALGMQSEEAKQPNSGSAISELPGYTMVDSSIKSELIGSAVFYDDRMVGTLTGEMCIRGRLSVVSDKVPSARNS